MPSEQTQLIERSICFRAKYRVRVEKRRYPPSHVVPHPKNRGGDPMAPTRLRQLGGNLVHEGYDLIEANTNGVAAQQKPKDKGGTGKEFQEAFSLSVKADHDIAEFGSAGTFAILGSLGHGHLSCLSRNVAAGLRGCECIELTVVGKWGTMKCARKARPISWAKMETTAWR